MFNDVMQIDAVYLLGFIKPMGLILMIGILFKFINYKVFDLEAGDIVVNFIKMTAYGSLGVYIYYNVKISGATEIDVLTFFTFLLACLESMHCFLNSIGAYFVAFLRVFIFPPKY
ncbi:hypothetical protein [Lysinibacillus odysseyi]|uniref:Uncharacterized protein n=1 Tax=Lysinibacillus odysseyi 34hs-1 = NBRC 100172 TaxID=1220589 RepID=A0A0A3JQ47_9BACI|nr:hypothetical protein [Lysinibacillus odysseyi]KGR89157.1 hypothetical protein CD32_00620 [Lysinibacillus odysseyi 34hs-1 = NBRC 100172]